MCEFRLLGPVEVVYAGRTLPIGAPKQRCVLARLLLEPGVPVPTEQLYAAVWGQDLPDAARKAVHVYISNLRRSLADVPDQEIRTAGGGYLIDVDRRRIDLHVFTELVENSDTPDALRQALSLWRGEPLGGLGDCPLSRNEGPRLTEQRLAVAERLAAAELSDGRAGTTIPTLYEVVSAHPLRETSYALLMRALAAEGRLGEALALYADVRERLLDQLGTEPSAVLTAVHRELLNAGAAGAAGAHGADGSARSDGSVRSDGSEVAGRSAPTDRSDDAARSDRARSDGSDGTDGTADSAGDPLPAQLPPRLTELAGRRAELERLRHLLENPPPGGVRIAAISGYGGVGKSTLALAAAYAVADRFDGGQLFADLGGSRDTPADPADVLAGFLRAYGVAGDRIPHRLPDRTALFRSVTAGRRVLLVLDDALNAEQLRPLLPGSAGSAVLLTSRARPAGLDGVQTLPLGELTDTESLTLLADGIGADRVRAEPAAAARIVHHCGGVPLAVRIAAGRLSRPSWTLATFADRLASTDPLDELYDGDLEVRTSFGLSYHRLSDAAARAFRLLAVAGTAGPTTFTLSCAAEILAEPERRLRRVLDGLVDLYLLEEPEPGRYRYHELLRRFAVEQALETDPAEERAAVVRRAFGHYAAVTMDALTTMMPGLRLPVPPGERPGFAGSEDAASWLAAEHVTVTDLALHMLPEIQRAIEDGGPDASDGGGDPAGGDPDGEARALAVRVASLTLSLGNYAEVGGSWPGREEVATRLLSIAERGGWGEVSNRVRTVLAGIAARRREVDTAVEQLEPVLQDALERDDLVTYGRLLAMLGVAHREADQPDRSAERLRAALEAHRRVGYARGYASTLIHLAELSNRLGEYTTTIRYARTALRIAARTEGNEPYLRMSAGQYLADARAATGRIEDARLWYRHALELATVHGSPTVRREVQPKLDRLEASRTPEDSGHDDGRVRS